MRRQQKDKTLPLQENNDNISQNDQTTLQGIFGVQIPPSGCFLPLEGCNCSEACYINGLRRCVITTDRRYCWRYNSRIQGWRNGRRRNASDCIVACFSFCTYGWITSRTRRCGVTSNLCIGVICPTIIFIREIKRCSCWPVRWGQGWSHRRSCWFFCRFCSRCTRWRHCRWCCSWCGSWWPSEALDSPKADLSRWTLIPLWTGSFVTACFFRGLVSFAAVHGHWCYWWICC
jgi:hypothetical protein